MIASSDQHRRSFKEHQRAGLAALVTAKQPHMTAVIPAHNEAATISETIRSLQQQSRYPDRIIVVCDNCTDNTADLATLAGAEVFFTSGNTAKKAGALNQVLTTLLPFLPDDDQVLVMDADSRLNRRWLELAALMLARNLYSGAVCGVFLGEPGAGLVGQLQRNEYIRYARQISRRGQVPVLSGTGTLLRASSLRRVAAERGQRLPGIPGEYYNSQSITEDDEITLGAQNPWPPVPGGRRLRDDHGSHAYLVRAVDSTAALAGGRIVGSAPLRTHRGDQHLLAPPGDRLPRLVRVGDMLGNDAHRFHSASRIRCGLDSGDPWGELPRAAVDSEEG